MKIQLLELTNFAAVFVGLRRSSLKLDFSKLPNIITILLGKMGSGKTTILSQLHPWCNLGTLDERNSDPLIRTGMDGCKHIVFNDNGDIYDITHKYIWTKDHHSIKSFFSFNGEELNQNGNQSTFKELVTKFMGIDQSYLRLMRIGPNVANLIDMGWGERKAFVADKIQEADIYADILVFIKQKIRECDSKASHLTKQLMNVTDDSFNVMKTRAMELKNSISELDDVILHTAEAIQKLAAQNQYFFDDSKVSTLGAYEALIDDMIHNVESTENEIESLRTQITSCDEFKNINDIMKALGKCNSDIDNNKRMLMALELQTADLRSKQSTLLTKKQNAGNKDYITNLANTYSEITNLIAQYTDELKDYNYEMTSSEIKSLMSDIQLLDEVLFDVFSANPEIVQSIINSGGDVISTSKRNIDKLQGKLLKLRNEINNMKYVAAYDVTDELPKVTDAKCKVCPYYTTHPNVIKSSTSSQKFTDKINEKMREIEVVNNKIDMYMEYPSVFTKVQKASKMLSSIKNKVSRIGALRFGDIRYILKSQKNRVWYDYDKIVDELSLAVKHEKLTNLQIKMSEIKVELDKYNSSDLTKLEEDLKQVSQQLVDSNAAIKEIEDNIDKTKSEQIRLNTLADIYTKTDEINKTIDTKNKELDEMDKRIELLQERREIIIANDAKITGLQTLLSQHRTDLNDKKTIYGQLTIDIHNISEGKKELEYLQKQLWIYDMIKDASSPQSGIPLLYVQIFLNDCINTANELISMVFGDSIELLDLDLSKPDFKIPYRKNGEILEDVKSASQGERATISLAISFALIRKCMSFSKNESFYNIMLLDEVDGPFYKDDREKFLLILSQQIKVNNVEQVFLISHNSCYDGYPINIIATSEIDVDDKNTPMINVY